MHYTHAPVYICKHIECTRADLWPTHKHLCQQTHKHMLTASLSLYIYIYITLSCCLSLSHTHTQTRTQTHTVISMLWHSAVRAAEEYDEYVFGTEQRDVGEEGIERRSRGKRDGGERGKEERKREIAGKREMFLMTLETDRKTATQLLLQHCPLSLSLSLPSPLCSLMTDHLGQSKVKLKSSVFIWK